MASPDEQACSHINPPPDIYPNYLGNWIVLIRRCGCSFEEKVRAAQNANYSAAIVHNVNSSELGKVIILTSRIVSEVIYAIYAIQIYAIQVSVDEYFLYYILMCGFSFKVCYSWAEDCQIGACRNVGSDNILYFLHSILIPVILLYIHQLCFCSFVVYLSFVFI
jgi:hypothetical protein